MSTRDQCQVRKVRAVAATASSRDLPLPSFAPSANLRPFRPPSAFRPDAELVTPRGYGFEEHYPITDDGYILGLYRIPPAVIQAASSNACVNGHAGGTRKLAKI